MNYTYDDLCGIMARLRGENGCPWDKQQTHESLRSSIIEEVYEFVDAVNNKDNEGMCEELGDILMLTVFHGGLAEESGSFTNADVINGICHKMISRHSHVFGEDIAISAEEALTTWDRNKSVEKAYAGLTAPLRSVPKALPALLRAQKVQSRAMKAGLMKQDGSAIQRLNAAVNALSAADTRDNQELSAKIGELLWQIADFSREFKINADFALTNSVETFINKLETAENGRD